MAAWGQLDKTPALLQEPEMTTRRANAIELAAYDGEPPPVAKPVWKAGLRELTGAHVGDQRLWFNASLHHEVTSSPEASSVHAPSTMSSEIEAISWASEGLVRVCDVLDGASVMSDATFVARGHGHLHQRPLTALRLGMAGQCEQWATALHDGTVVPTDARCLPSDLLDEDGPQQQYAVQCARTLVQRPLAPLCKLKMRHIYESLTAACFSMPRTLDPAAGSAARHAGLFSDIPAWDDRTRAMARAVRCVRCKAVPPEMTETAFRVLHSGFPFGPNKSHICGRDTCPCGGGHAETVEHTFKNCPRTKRLWELVLAQWRTVTGEAKVTTEHGRIVLLGDRSVSWETEADRPNGRVSRSHGRSCTR